MENRCNTKIFFFLLGILFLFSFVSAEQSFNSIQYTSSSNYLQTNPHGITQNGTFFWIADYQDRAVYRYLINGTYSNSFFNTSAYGNNNPSGIAIYGDKLYVTDDIQSVIFRYWVNGTFNGNISLIADASGITTNGTRIWTVYEDEELALEQTMSGAYTGVIVNLSTLAQPVNLVMDSNYLYIVDLSSVHKVFEYSLNGNLSAQTGGSFYTNISGGMGQFPYGITMNDTFFWITDYIDDKIHQYRIYKNDSCGFINNISGNTYTLNNSIIDNSSGSYCFSLGNNQVFDCNGYWINMTNSGSYGAIRVDGGNTTIKNCKIYNAGYNSLLLNNDNEAYGYSTIFNNTIVSLDTGIYTYGRKINISKNNITSNGDGIYLTGACGEYLSQNVYILFNNIVSGNSTYDYGRGIYAECSYDVNVSNNYVNSYKWSAFYGDSISSTNLTNNYFRSLTNTTGSGIHYDGDSAYLKNNTGIGGYGGIVILSSGSGDVLINNYGNGTNYLGLTVQGSSDCNLTNNLGVSSNYSGVWLYGNSFVVSNLTGRSSSGYSSTHFAFGLWGSDSILDDVTGSATNGGVGFEVFNGVSNIFTDITSTTNGNYSLQILNAQDNIFRQCSLSGGTTYDIYFSNGGNTNNSFVDCDYNSSKESVLSSDELFRKWYYQLYAAYNNGTRINNANVTIYDRFGTLQFTDFTDSNGGITQQELPEYINNATKYFYSNYTVYLKYGDITHSYTFNLTDNLITYFIAPLAQTNVDIVSPTNYQSFNYQTNIPVSVTESSTNGLSMCWYSKNNGATNTTFTCGNNFTVSEAGEGTYNLIVWANDSFNNLGRDSVNYVISLTAPAVTISYPESGSGLSSSTIDLNVTAVDSSGIQNCSLWGNFSGTWTRDQTSTSITSGVTKKFSKTLSDGYYKFNFQCFDVGSLSSFAASNFTFSIDATPPTASINSISTTAGYQNISFSSTETDASNIVCKYSIFNNLGGVDGLNNNVTYACNSNPHIATTTTYGTYFLNTFVTDAGNNVKSTRLSFTTSAATGGVFTPSTPSGGGGGGGLDLNETLSAIGFCGDNICQDGTNGTIDRGEDFYSCSIDCSRIYSIFSFDTFNFETLVSNCFSSVAETQDRCFWKKTPGLLVLLVLIIAFFVFSIFFSIKPLSKGGTKRIIYNPRRRRR